MKRWIEMAIKERKVTFVLAFAILLYGLYSYYYLPKQENPDTSSPVAQIITVLPGATAEEVESLVTRKIEKSVMALEGISYVTSYSNPSASIVLVSLNYDVDYDEQWRLLKNLMEDIKSELPDNALAPEVDTNLTESTGAVYALTGDAVDKSKLAYALSEKLSKIEGVKKIAVEGAYEPAMEVLVDQEELKKIPLTLSQIVDVIQINNLTIPAGTVQEKGQAMGIATEKGLENKNELENLILFTNPVTQAPYRLKEVSKVQEVNQNNRQYWVDSNEAVLVNVYFDANQNIVLVGEELKDAVGQFEVNHKGLKIEPFVFQPESVKSATEDFMMNLLQGVGFVVLVILLGMGIRNAVVVSTSIPLSIAMTIGVMYFMGIDLQQMSIAALIISLGILVDNSIVISDAIQEHLDLKVPIFHACFQGTRESSIPVLTSTLTTVASFAPLMVLPGEAGEFAKSLPLVVIISLMASYFVAIFVVPALGSVFFKKNKQTRHHSKNLTRRLFTWVLGQALSKRKTAYAFILLILLAAGYGAMQLEISLFPYADKDLVYIDVSAPTGSSLSKTNEILDQVQALVFKEKGVGKIFKSLGGSFPKFYLTVGVRPPSDDFGQIVFNVAKGSSDDREAFVYKLQKKIEESGIEGRFTVNLLEINQPGPAIDVKIYGEKREGINQVADQIEAFLKSDSRAIKVYNDKTSTLKQKILKYDEASISSKGLMLFEVQRQVNIALSGSNATDLIKEDKVTPVLVKGKVPSFEDLKTLKIGVGKSGEPILLSEVAYFSEIDAMKQMKRHNQNPAVFVSADLKPGASAASLQADVEAYVTSLNLGSEVDIAFGGDKEIVDKYIKDILGAAIIAIIIIYLILLIQFNSFKQPVIVLATVPLSIVGSVGILLLFNMKITFTVGLGVASLIGIVVNNAILLLDYFKNNDEGIVDYKRLCISAMNRRFKPIMLSSITTIIGLVPLALSGSSFFTPMAVALMGGLMVSTLLTLIVIPLIYYSTLPKSKKLMKL